MTLTYDLIMRWQRGTVAEQIAADLASQINNGNLSRWDSLPLNSTLADKWNVSERTITKAKRLLCDHGMLMLVDRRFYVGLSSSKPPRPGARPTTIEWFLGTLELWKIRTNPSWSGRAWPPGG